MNDSRFVRPIVAWLHTLFWLLFLLSALILLRPGLDSLALAANKLLQTLSDLFYSTT